MVTGTAIAVAAVVAAATPLPLLPTALGPHRPWLPASWLATARTDHRRVLTVLRFPRS
ncbi:hypothetical protein CLV70_11033 [Pseudosporangium ferrugineum]|uniref:Uncharacterized protein n=1 Tax=Pseudosporangium ferrugineum TaxID=439699 RepID=A0A2T0S213_9ACTN|nr:hypothetical protein CLV70_11033 [Pseudosporangium ferrugineum]